MIRGRRKTRIGRVVSDKMDKTVVVAVEWRQTHPLYDKSVKRITKFHAHDEDNGCKVGDMVNIMETRPLSKTKRWRVTQILATGDIPASAEILELPSVEMEGGDESDDAESGDQEKES
ncbi:MAG: 30S ribosomal protein S17 [Chloroflexota bacterium]